MAMEMGMGGLMGASNGGGVSESKDHTKSCNGAKSNSKIQQETSQS